MTHQGFGFEKVIIYQLNPKSITMGQMYGEFDPSTHEWQDGIVSTMYRWGVSSKFTKRGWIVGGGRWFFGGVSVSLDASLVMEVSLTCEVGLLIRCRTWFFQSVSRRSIRRSMACT